MDAFLATAALVAIGAITPGPNNLVVLEAAARAGVRGAVPAIAGVVLGSVALLAAVAVGAGGLLAAAPRARLAIAMAGCLYLAWLGAGLVAGSFRDRAASRQPAPAARAGVAALFVFQFLNPKSWVMAVTAVTAMGPDPVRAFVRLAAIFTVVPLACLLLWSSLGALLSAALARQGVRAWFDRAMGGLLVLSALLLLVELRLPGGRP